MRARDLLEALRNEPVPLGTSHVREIVSWVLSPLVVLWWGWQSWAVATAFSLALALSGVALVARRRRRR